MPATAEPLKAREYWALARPGPRSRLAARPLRSPTSPPSSTTPELAARVVARLDAAVALAFELEKLEQTGIRVVASVDADYPPRLLRTLTTAAPPLLHVVGPIALTERADARRGRLA